MPDTLLRFQLKCSTNMCPSVFRITSKDPFLLIQDLKADTVTCVEVLSAYFHAAILASKLVNCVYEFLPEEALELPESSMLKSFSLWLSHFSQGNDSVCRSCCHPRISLLFRQSGGLQC